MRINRQELFWVLPLAKNNARFIAVKVLTEVITQNRSIGVVLSRHLDQLENPSEQGFTQDLVYGVARWYPRIEFFVAQLLTRALKPKDFELKLLIAIGIYQLAYSRVPSYAAINETVKQVKPLKRDWARALVNGVLREFARKQADLEQKMARNEVARTAHPQWFIEQLKIDWPEDWEKILAANNQHPPMSLRVNARQLSRAKFMQQLSEAAINAHAIAGVDYGVELESPLHVDSIPGFFDGNVSVQDGAAQIASQLLSLTPQQRVLDACAAPGGKTAAIIEQQKNLLEVVALDIKEARIDLINDTLSRLNLAATLICADAGDVEKWWDGQHFDRILLDVPCSATGVIRRNPDIKILRSADDVRELVLIQENLLNTIWQTLKPGGLLIYATCSVLQVENAGQLERFFARHQDAKEIKIDANWGKLGNIGRYVLPGENGMDGFYYACITKRQA